MSDLCCEYTNGISGQNRRYFTKLSLMEGDHGKLYTSAQGANATELKQNILFAYGHYEPPSFDLSLLKDRFKSIHQKIGGQK